MVAVLGGLGDQPHRNSLLPEILQGVGAVDLGEGPGVVEPAVPDVIEGSGLRTAGVEPVGGLVDDAQMPLGWVGVGDQELQLSVVPQGPQHLPQDSALGVGRQGIGQPEPGQGEAVL